MFHSLFHPNPAPAHSCSNTTAQKVKHLRSMSIFCYNFFFSGQTSVIFLIKSSSPKQTPFQLKVKSSSKSHSKSMTPHKNISIICILISETQILRSGIKFAPIINCRYVFISSSLKIYGYCVEADFLTSTAIIYHRIRIPCFQNGTSISSTFSSVAVSVVSRGSIIASLTNPTQASNQGL